jgi:hypothetical protein
MTLAIWLHGAACGALVGSAATALLWAVAAWNHRVNQAQQQRRPQPRGSADPRRPQPYGGRLVDISRPPKPPQEAD